MLICAQFADAVQIHQLLFPAAARKQLTFLRDPVSDASYQPTHGDYFVFARDAGGDENYQKYRFDRATGQVTLLTDGTSRNTGGSYGGHMTLVTATRYADRIRCALDLVGHGLVKKQNEDFLLYATVMFMQKYLLN